MSMNRFMHPRNIYKTPPNFKQLAIEYPEFREHVKQDVTGKITVDFKDVAALRSLTCTLLKKDFGLEVELPLNKLIPTVPLRLNYILWIEDLLSISGGMDCIKGIDIGTGASCIYPLLAAKLHGWSMLATEVDRDSVTLAKRNVERNSLQSFITVKKIEGDSLLLEALGDSPEQYDFCMCNPPFFSTTQELNCFFKSRKESRPRPRNAFCASVNEVVAKGGEVDFITKLIEESERLQDKVRIYTTMIGHKTSLMPLKTLLRQANVVSFKQTEFCQGHTTRWGLAWTFCDIDLRKVPEMTVAASRKQKPKCPFRYMIPPQDGKSFEVEEVARRLENMFLELTINLENIKRGKNVIAYNFTATRNTWLHQRRKRRAQRRLSKLSNSSDDAIVATEPTPPPSGETSLENTSMEVDGLPQATETSDCVCGLRTDLEHALNKLAEVDVNSSPGSAKRELEDDDADDFYQSKKFRSDTGECKCHLNEFFVKGLLVVRRDEESHVWVELSWLEGSENREVLHQILQYVKNNFKFN